MKGPVWGLFLIAPLDLERMHVHVLLHTNAFCSKAMLGVLTSNEMVRNGPGRFLEPQTRTFIADITGEGSVELRLSSGNCDFFF